MCFVHSGDAGGGGLVQRAAVGETAAAAFSSVAAGGTLSGEGDAAGGMEVAGAGRPDVVAGPGGPDVAGPGGPDVAAGAGSPPPRAAGQAERVLDGFGQVLHNRWNRDLPPAATVRPGEVIQLLCRDALDIGEAARTLTPDGVMTLDLGGVHPLTGPVAVEGAEPGDILEVEVLDVAPLVDFGYVVISPVLGLFGSLRPDLLAPFTQFTEASQISDPNPGRVPRAVPEDQPYNSGAPFVQLFRFERGQNTGFATFTGADTGRQARIPIVPFMGIYGAAPLRTGMYRTLPPSVSGAMGGNADIRQLVKGARIQLPVYAEGALFSAGDGHMAQGDGEVCVTAIETLMAVTLRFQVIKNTIIASPRAIVPAADPTQLAMPAEMLGQGYYHTTGAGPDLMENAKNAVRDMVDWLVADQQLSLHEAYALCSVAGDLKISETVDLPNWVVSMTLPRGIFT
jgi:acetamidase/formamidase